MDKLYELLNELRPECDYRASENFIEDGLLDSFDTISLVSMIEDTYEILIDALDILPENFCSAEAIANIIVKNGGEI